MSAEHLFAPHPSRLAGLCIGWSGAMHSRPRDAARWVAAWERAIALTDADEHAAGYFHISELYDLLADEYQQLGRVDDALAAMREALAAGWDGQPDGRCRLAEIL